jgi:hypothetical protein
MKILKTSAICVLLSVCYFTSSAQAITLNETDQRKPHLFSDMPEKMKLKITDLETLLDLPVGSSVNTSIAGNFHFQGTVVSTSAITNTGSKTVVIKSTNRKGATLTFTKATGSNGTVKYLGRIISMKNGDAFEIVKENGQYILQKKALYDLVSE